MQNTAQIPTANRTPSPDNGQKTYYNGRPGSSSVTNGARLFAESLDGRTALARRYADLLALFTSDIGGDPSEAQKQLIRRAASLSVWCENQELKLASGEDVEIGPLTTATNSLRRVLADIGLQRVARDVTPDFASYVRGGK